MDSSSASSSGFNNNDMQSLKYLYASNVNVSNFVSEKLSSDDNYPLWKAQMLCLMESQEMRGIVDNLFDDPRATYFKTVKQYDSLLKGWIFGSLTPDVLRTVVDLESARDVWCKLQLIYDIEKSSTQDPASQKRLNLAQPHGASSSGFNNNDIEENIPVPDIAKYIPLHRAIMCNNWEEAKRIFDMDRDAVSAKIDVDGHTPLHIAIRTRNRFFVRELLYIIRPGSLPDLRCNSGWSPLHTAASVGNLEIVRTLVATNESLLFIADEEGHLPVNTAIINFHIDTFKFLLERSKFIPPSLQFIFGEDVNYCGPFDGEKGVRLLINVILCGELEIAYKLVKDFPSMAQGTYDGTSPLYALASKSDAYLSGEQYNFYQRFHYSLILIDMEKAIKNPELNMKDKEADFWLEEIRNKDRYPGIKKSRTPQGIFWEVAARVVPRNNKVYQDMKKHTAAGLLLECICKEVGALTEKSRIVQHYWDGFNLAVENDTPEVIEAIIRYFPQATTTTYKGYGLSQNAIKNRSEKVYNIAVEHAGYDNNLRICIDEEGNNLLHLAGKLASIHKLNEVSGAALQMQREFQWFKAVEKFVSPSVREQKNKAGETPMMVFREQHKDLRKDGEEWMKKTAESYTITSALILTIAFAAAITVPGGNNGDTGKAIFEKQTSFRVFVAMDSVSFFSATYSLLLFQYVLTGRNREEDFLDDLPTTILLGLFMLILSMTFMIIAFSAALYLLIEQENPLFLMSLALSTCMLSGYFITLQFPILTELIYSTYRHEILSKERDS